MQTYAKAVELKRLLQQGQEYPVDLLDELINDIEKLEYETKQEVKVRRPEHWETPLSLKRLIKTDFSGKEDFT